MSYLLTVVANSAVLEQDQKINIKKSVTQSRKVAKKKKQELKGDVEEQEKATKRFLSFSFLFLFLRLCDLAPLRYAFLILISPMRSSGDPVRIPHG